MKTVFGTVAYESSWKYMKEFSASLNGQTDLGFTILVVCDNLSSKCLSQLQQTMQREVILTEIYENMTIPALRAELLRQAKKQGFDLLILGDFDDLFSNRRVEAIKKAYTYNPQACFFYNEICDFEGKKMFSYLPQKVTDISQISECNFLGLSNTAINLHKMSWEFIDSLAMADTPVFDWYLYSRLLLDLQTGILVSGVDTFYRIHDNNIAGIVTSNEENYKKELKVKWRHYGLLQQFDQRFKDLRQDYEKLFTNGCSYQKMSFKNKDLKGYWWELVKVRGIRDV